jgi:hypothetical protein
MPIQRINEFPEGSGSLSNDDVFLFMDDPSGDGVTKKISLSQIGNVIGGGNTVNVVQIGTYADPFIGGTLDLDASEGNIFDIIINGNTLISNPTNGTNGQTIRLRVEMNTGDIIITLGSGFVIPSTATNPLPWSTAPGKMDILAATYHAVREKWDVIAFVPGY